MVKNIDPSPQHRNVDLDNSVAVDGAALIYIMQRYTAPF